MIVCKLCGKEIDNSIEGYVTDGNDYYHVSKIESEEIEKDGKLKVNLKYSGSNCYEKVLSKIKVI